MKILKRHYTLLRLLDKSYKYSLYYTNGMQTINDAFYELAQKIYRKMPYFGRPFRGQETIVPPTGLLPDTVTDVHLDEIRHGSLYCLTFTKK